MKNFKTAAIGFIDELNIAIEEFETFSHDEQKLIIWLDGSDFVSRQDLIRLKAIRDKYAPQV